MRKSCLFRNQDPSFQTALAGIFILAVVMLTATPSACRSGEIRFEQLSIEEGLSQSIVLCITQDQDGFMWFGTEDGLNKYDGYEFSVVRHDPENANSLAVNLVTSLCAGRDGYLWIGMFMGGVDRLNPVTGEFRHFRHNPSDSTTLSHDNVLAIYEDSGGDIWVGTTNGLNRLNRETGEFVRYYHDPGDPNSLCHNSVNVICEDNDFLWIGTAGGVSRMNIREESFRNFLFDPSTPGGISHNAIVSIFMDSSDNIWIGTNGGGLNLFERDTGRFRHFQHHPGDPRSLSHNAVFSIFEDRTGSLWIGTNGGGLDMLDRETMEFRHHVNDPSDPYSLSYDEIYAIFEDRTGVVWLGTYGGGINKFDTKRKAFRHYKQNPDDPNSLSHGIVWSVLEDEDGILWIGTHGGGLNRFDRKTGRYRHFRNDPDDPASLSNDIVRVVLIDSRGDLWLGTHGGGLCKMIDRRKGRFVSYRNDNSDSTTISHNQLRSIYEDSNGTMWIGTNGGGLNRFDRDTGKFVRYRNDPDDPSSISNDFIRVIYEDSRGYFWLGTQGGGLNRFDRKSGKAVHFVSDSGGDCSINSNFVFSIYEDTEGIFWLGTWGGGLNRFDPESGRFTAFTEKDGLGSNSIYGVLEDSEGNLWMSTNNGLSRFNPATGEFKNYNERDGLQSNEFNGGSYFRSDNGEMFFGGINGFNSFYPGDIKDNPFKPNVVITSFKIMNKEIPLEKNISNHDHISLSYRDYSFSFEFAALEYSAPEKNMYSYKMEGLNDDWIYTDYEKRFANFTTLPPGEYTLRIKGSNNDGVWNNEGVALGITITPPLWQKNSFRIAVFILAAAIGLVWYRRRVQTVRMKTELDTAHRAQMSIMPQSPPEVRGFDIAGKCIPAYEVGGDFFDYLWIGDHGSRLAVLVGDVSGKAMQAAMIAVMSSGMMNAALRDGGTARDALTSVNKSIYMKTGETMFTALCLCILDVESKTAVFACAGMNAPLIKSREGVSVLIRKGCGLPLGAFPDSTYEEDSILMQPGDVLAIFTDGVIEARDRNGEFYSDRRLRAFLESLDTAPISSAKICDSILEDIQKFTENKKQDDDITMIIIKAE